MCRCGVIFVLVLALACVHATARNVPNEEQQVVLHASAPDQAESPAGSAAGNVNDKKNFIYGGVGGFAGMGGYAGIIGGLPLIGGAGGIGKYGGIGGIGGIGGVAPLGTTGGLGGAAAGSSSAGPAGDGNLPYP